MKDLVQWIKDTLIPIKWVCMGQQRRLEDLDDCSEERSQPHPRNRNHKDQRTKTMKNLIVTLMTMSMNPSGCVVALEIMNRSIVDSDTNPSNDALLVPIKLVRMLDFFILSRNQNEDTIL